MTIKKTSPLSSALYRFFRVLIAIILAGIAAQYGDSQYYLLIAPALNGVAKYLRDEFGLDLLLI
jgi:hypothetical protein